MTPKFEPTERALELEIAYAKKLLDEALESGNKKSISKAAKQLKTARQKYIKYLKEVS